MESVLSPLCRSSAVNPSMGLHKSDTILRRVITVKGYAVEAISFVEGQAEDKAQITPSTLVTNASRFTPEKYPDFAGLSTGEIIDTLCYR